MLVGCSVSEAPTLPAKDETQSRGMLGLESFQVYGTVHNEILDNSLQAFKESDAVANNYQEAIDYLVSLQCEQVAKSTLPGNTKTRICEGIALHKESLYAENLKQKFLDVQNGSFDPFREKILAIDMNIWNSIAEYLFTSRGIGFWACLFFVVVFNKLWRKIVYCMWKKGNKVERKVKRWFRRKFGSGSDEKEQRS